MRWLLLAVIVYYLDSRVLRKRSCDDKTSDDYGGIIIYFNSSIYICIHIYIYIHIYRERDIERQRVY